MGSACHVLISFTLDPSLWKGLLRNRKQRNWAEETCELIWPSNICCFFWRDGEVSFVFLWLPLGLPLGEDVSFADLTTMRDHLAFQASPLPQKWWLNEESHMVHMHRISSYHLSVQSVECGIGSYLLHGSPIASMRTKNPAQTLKATWTFTLSFQRVASTKP